MNSGTPQVELLFLWHHHQPDYRSPRTGTALLPWVRLHAVKDYLDMALRLERHPDLRATFNFVPALVDQLEDAVAGRGDALFDLLALPASELTAEQRQEVGVRCAAPPPRLRERWPRYTKLGRKVTRAADGGRLLTDRELEELEAWFLLAWLDPMFHGEPEAAAALTTAQGPDATHRDSLLALYRRLIATVLPAYRRLAERGQIELSTSPYAHPILPLLVDTASARRARPDLHLPSPGLAAPEDAARQIERARAHHLRVFGAPPRGLWPSEGSVSPEVAEIVARQGLRWMATDEGILWRSLSAGERKRGALHRPWSLVTPAGTVSVFFRDHELSDRIGFVYHHWEAADAVADFLVRLRRIGAEHAGGEAPVVTVALDGENCWEHYKADGGPFLDGLYAALSQADDIRTVTPGDVLERRGPGAPLPTLHTGSWIDADFHIWIGHPEKNRAWERIARARADLVASGLGETEAPAAWESLHAAEGSDWFWWLGVDHHTSDKALFDRILREHLAATYERRGAPAPAGIVEPISRLEVRTGESAPLGYLRPVIDGRVTSYYEWKAAGRRGADGGSSMHRAPGVVRDLYYGFDERRLFLRIDAVELAGPTALRVELEVRSGSFTRHLNAGATPGQPEAVHMRGPAGDDAAVPGARFVTREV
ncbi:MAG: glycoside hydrolase family 57 protein, partial [Candidatus Eisenbacteria bacterium]